MSAAGIKTKGIIRRHHKMSLKERSKVQIVAYLFLIPALIAYALTKYYPILMGFFISFYNIDIVHLPGTFVGFANYVRAFNDPEFFQSVWVTVKFFLIGTVLTFWPPLVLAILINEVRRGKVFFRTMYFLPAVAPGIAMAVLWKYIWQPDYGFANSLMTLLHLPQQMWLNDPAIVIWCLYFPGFIMAGGMTMLIYLAAVQEVPEERYEAAMIEGAGFFARIRYITLPQIMPIVKIMFVLSIIGSFNEAGLPFVMTGGGPIGASETMILFAYKSAMNNLDYSYAITLANTVFVIIFIVTAIQMRLSANKD